MTSYAASAHIAGARPRLRSGSPEDMPPGVWPELATTVHMDHLAAPSTPGVGVSGARLELLVDEDGGLDAWIERLQVIWSQTTWYLFNAEGWR